MLGSDKSMHLPCTCTLEYGEISTVQSLISKLLKCVQQYAIWMYQSASTATSLPPDFYHDKHLHFELAYFYLQGIRYTRMCKINMRHKVWSLPKFPNKPPTITVTLMKTLDFKARQVAYFKQTTFLCRDSRQKDKGGYEN